MISIDEFLKVDLRVGMVLSAEEIEGSDKLLKLQVNLGEERPRQILAGIKKWYKPEDLVGEQVIVVANLEPRQMVGFESQGMMLAASCEEEPILLTVPKESAPGSKIR